MTSPDTRRASNVLKAWAAMGSTVSSREAGRCSWDVFKRLIPSATEKLRGDAERLRSLLKQSRTLFAPLDEPFDTEMGLNRWLGASREEAYSDWLAWVFQQVGSARRVFDMLQLPFPKNIAPASAYEVARDCCIPFGHDEREGRLDLVIRFGQEAIVVVEVKKGDADGADTLKQRGYVRWLNSQRVRHKHQVLIANSGEQELYENFQFVSWSSLCVEMRLLALEFVEAESQLNTAALTLGFVSAVEQNLLGFSAGLAKSICAGRRALFNPALVDHLEAFISRQGGDRGRHNEVSR